MDHLLSREKDKIDTSIHTKHQKTLFYLVLKDLVFHKLYYFFLLNNEEGL